KANLSLWQTPERTHSTSIRPPATALMRWRRIPHFHWPLARTRCFGLPPPPNGTSILVLNTTDYFINRPPFLAAFFMGGTMTEETEAEHLDVHVAVCAERYKALEGRLDRIERVMWWMLSTLIMAMGGMLFEMFILIGRKVI